jgi:hypothetical protein
MLLQKVQREAASRPGILQQALQRRLRAVDTGRR